MKSGPIATTKVRNSFASVTTNIMGRTICALGDAASMPVQSFIKHFRDEFAYHIEHKKCLVPVDVQRAGSGFFTATV